MAEDTKEQLPWGFVLFVAVLFVILALSFVGGVFGIKLAVEAITHPLEKPKVIKCVEYREIAPGLLMNTLRCERWEDEKTPQGVN